MPYENNAIMHEIQAINMKMNSKLCSPPWEGFIYHLIPLKQFGSGPKATPFHTQIKLYLNRRSLSDHGYYDLNWGWSMSFSTK